MGVRAVTEAEFTRQVIQLARLHGWLTFHARPGLDRRGRWRTAVQGDGRGFVDLVLVRETVLWVELKVGSNRLTPEQGEWLDALRAAGQRVYCWFPADWPEIEKTLAPGGI